MDVGVNQFSGSFDAMLGGLSFIIGFRAERNMLSGSLPQAMASLGLMVCLTWLGFGLMLSAHQH